MNDLLIAGGGIGGLAAAVAARRADWHVRLCEQASAFSEVGAGIQLGPNATRILREWGLLQGDFLRLAAAPARLRVRDGVDGAQLAVLELGAAIAQRHGAPYLAVHRADLQSALLDAAQAAGAQLHTGTRLARIDQDAAGVTGHTAGQGVIGASACVVADGVWSVLRGAVAADGPPPSTGHLAYRALVRQADLPPALRSEEVTAWLAPRMHLVAYPVRGGDWLNVVCVVQGTQPGDPRDWDHAASQEQLRASLGPVCGELRQRVEAIGDWRLWVLHAREPVRSAAELARGRIALLGDAGHPMRPYLAQGAGMAIEDARELERMLAMERDGIADEATAFRRYALNRWERVARVQAKSRRNGVVFHATGALRAGRNAALRMVGAKLLDQPWLYGR